MNRYDVEVTFTITMKQVFTELEAFDEEDIERFVLDMLREGQYGYDSSVAEFGDVHEYEVTNIYDYGCVNVDEVNNDANV